MSGFHSSSPSHLFFHLQIFINRAHYAAFSWETRELIGGRQFITRCTPPPYGVSTISWPLHILSIPIKSSIAPVGEGYSDIRRWTDRSRYETVTSKSKYKRVKNNTGRESKIEHLVTVRRGVRGVYWQAASILASYTQIVIKSFRPNVIPPKTHKETRKIFPDDQFTMVQK